MKTLEGLRRGNNEVPSGVGPAGDMNARMGMITRLMGFQGNFDGEVKTLEPGEFRRMASNPDMELNLAAPIAYDVYYLFRHINVLPDDERGKVWIDMKGGRLYDVFEALGGIKPLITGDQATMATYKDFDGIKNHLEGNGVYTIKEARYETILPGQDFQFPPKMNIWDEKKSEFKVDTPSDFSPENYVAYLSFPMAQLGVMKLASIIYETQLSNYSFSHLENGWLDGLMPPVDGNKINGVPGHLPNPMPGRLLIDLGYEIVDESVLYPCLPYKGVEDNKYHKWLTLAVESGDTFPYPGEFFALLVKPLPFHVWWYQKTSPFVYSGNWFETEFYTSGIIEAKYDQQYDEYTDSYHYMIDDRSYFADDDEVGPRYKVRVKGETIYMKSTDWYEYSVGERVAILRSWEPSGKSFTWQDRYDQTDGGEDESYTMDPADGAIDDWRIIPVSFYK